MEGHPQPSEEVDGRRHLREGLHSSADPDRCRRRPRLGRRGRLHHSPRTSARRRGPSKGAPAASRNDHALGRSRGGLTTKIHLASDGHCRPAAFHITPGQAGDAPAFTQVMARLRAPRPTGRPKVTPQVVLADKAYSSRAIRTHLHRRGIRAVIDRLPSAQHRRAAHQQTQAVARPCHSIRQDRHRLPGRTAHRGIFIWSAR